MELLSQFYQPSFYQVGSNWAVTAAHCVYSEEAEGPVEAVHLSLFLGVHDRGQLTSRAR